MRRPSAPFPGRRKQKRREEAKEGKARTGLGVALRVGREHRDVPAEVVVLARRHGARGRVHVDAERAVDLRVGGVGVDVSVGVGGS